jgi:hypothetical protein
LADSSSTATCAAFSKPIASPIFCSKLSLLDNKLGYIVTYSLINGEVVLSDKTIRYNSYERVTTTVPI